jgi:hypothetical protein
LERAQELFQEYTIQQFKQSQKCKIAEKVVVENRKKKVSKFTSNTMENYEGDLNRKETASAKISAEDQNSVENALRY